MATRDPIVKSLAPSDETWTFLDGNTRQVVSLQNTIIRIGQYELNWRWSEHEFLEGNKPLGAHVEYLIFGRFRIKEANTTERDIGPGEGFEVGADQDA